MAHAVALINLGTKFSFEKWISEKKGGVGHSDR